MLFLSPGSGVWIRLYRMDASSFLGGYKTNLRNFSFGRREACPLLVMSCPSQCHSPVRGSILDHVRFTGTGRVWYGHYQ